MKKSRILGCLMLVISGLLFVQCTHEDPYVGIDGEDGVDGNDGVNGEFVCVQCHNTSHRDSITASYSLSIHAIQTDMGGGQLLADYTNRTSCAQCHTNEGYIEYMETGTVSDTVPVPSAISCTTCHSTHKTFDFATDGQDYALRNTEPLQLMVDETYHIDYGNASNACISCHQPRRSGPTDDGTGLFTITSSHWGPHHGPQSTLLEGIVGMPISGSTSYPAIGSAAHRTGSSCTNCHMGETTDGNDGSHSMHPTSNACISCHVGGAPSEVSGLAAYMHELELLLEQVVSQDGTVVGIVHDGHPVQGTFTVLEAQAAWNYLYILEDKSEGIHNPSYSKALIKNSIEALD